MSDLMLCISEGLFQIFLEIVFGKKKKKNLETSSFAQPNGAQIIASHARISDVIDQKVVAPESFDSTHAHSMNSENLSYKLPNPHVITLEDA